jgi:hypothetical protein
MGAKHNHTAAGSPPCVPAGPLALGAAPGCRRPLALFCSPLTPPLGRRDARRAVGALVPRCAAQGGAGHQCRPRALCPREPDLGFCFSRQPAECRAARGRPSGRPAWARSGAPPGRSHPFVGHPVLHNPFPLLKNRAAAWPGAPVAAGGTACHQARRGVVRRCPGRTPSTPPLAYSLLWALLLNPTRRGRRLPARRATPFPHPKEPLAPARTPQDCPAPPCPTARPRRAPRDAAARGGRPPPHLGRWWLSQRPHCAAASAPRLRVAGLAQGPDPLSPAQAPGAAPFTARPSLPPCCHPTLSHDRSPCQLCGVADAELSGGAAAAAAARDAARRPWRACCAGAMTPAARRARRLAPLPPPCAMGRELSLCSRILWK